MHSGERWRLGHRPALDGLRGVAILLVLIGHGVLGLEPVAWAGVTLFFGLSGFLITALLLEERATHGRIRLGAFWVRRARRLMPALLVMVGVTSALLAGAGFRVNPLPALAYYANWASIGGGDLGYFWRHTWSLAVEEQFYLVWPLVVVFMRTRRAVTMACLVGIGWSLGVTVAFWGDFNRVYEGTDTRMWALLLGGLLGARLVGSVRSPSSAPAWLSGDILRWFGRRSYGIYLWHYPLTLIMPPVLGILLSLLVAEASWRFVEQPLLRGRSGGLIHSVDPDEVAHAPGKRDGRAEHIRRPVGAAGRPVEDLELSSRTRPHPST